MIGIYARTSRDNPLDVTSTIDQQIEAGINFALANNLPYEVYSDKGISGYKIDEKEDEDPFNNRPEFTKLINDIKLGKIDTVWVWEHSRISRNTYASAYIFNIFSQYKIKLYEKDKLYDLNDPTVQMTRQILDAVAQYERHLIVGRTTRGFYNAIDLGKKAHAKFFGYKKIGRNNNGDMQWEPVESEIEQLKVWYAKFLDGKSLRSIITDDLTSSDEATVQAMLRRTTKLGRFLGHFEYTGYSLTVEGIKIYDKYKNFEIDNIQILKKDAYWVKSIPYPVEIITREQWVDIRERLQENKKIHNKAKTRAAEKSLATGLVQCSCCGLNYYYYHMHYNSKKRGLQDFYYYYHHKTMNNELCANKPKSLSVERIDAILEVFMFYYSVAFDSSKDLIADLVKKQEIESKALLEKKHELESGRKKKQKQLEKLQIALDDSEDVADIKIFAKQIAKVEDEITLMNKDIASTTIELEKLNNELKENNLKLKYYSVKSFVIAFHEQFNIEEKRNAIIKVAKSIVLYGQYLVVTGDKATFVFDTKISYPFPQENYDKLKAGEMYFESITQSVGEGKNKSDSIYGRFYNGKQIEYRRYDEKFDHVSVSRPAMRDCEKILSSKGINLELDRKSSVVLFIDVE